MDTLLKCLLVVGKYVVAWLAMPHWVKQIKSNDLPHLKAAVKDNAKEIGEVKTALAEQIGFCKGRQACGDGESEREPRR